MPALAVLILLVQVSLARRAAANVDPPYSGLGCSGSGVKFVGFDDSITPVASIEGVSANIRVELGAMCHPVLAGDLSASWAMILEDHAHALARHVVGGLAQVGFLTGLSNQSSNPTFFYEINNRDASGMVQTWHSGAPVGVFHRFWVQVISSGCPAGLIFCFSYNIDTTRLTTSTFDPVASWGSPTSNPWQMEFYGETHDSNDNVPGTDAGGVATIWNTVQKQSWVTDAYSSVDCNMHADATPRYGLNYPSNQGCGTWSTYTIL